eukprot:gnl/TRDRNA2_/TRDRNA2_173838_c6_seq4.p1 gnl/TRDRNA2_/TRDRNA2_173838_c6~~gnl/TRDRNA2_/TRDRNA2_173838_c6_seq4.p1  ORF type:complete len:121 (+),score=14.84 gnl/TRDRNA2_/TRDRNA2_173838_c6_seq4:364-726(+)
MSTVSSQQLSALLAGAAERHLSEFNAQGLASVAWACASMSRSDVRLFGAISRAAEQKLHSFSTQDVSMALQGLSMHSCLADAWSLLDRVKCIDVSKQAVKNYGLCFGHVVQRTARVLTQY